MKRKAFGNTNSLVPEHIRKRGRMLKAQRKQCYSVIPAASASAALASR